MCICVYVYVTVWEIWGLDSFCAPYHRCVHSCSVCVCDRMNGKVWVLNSPLFVSLKFDVSRWSWTSLSQKNDRLYRAPGCANAWNPSRTLKSTWQILKRASVLPHTPHPDLRESVLTEARLDSGFRNDFSSNPWERHRGSPNAPPSPRVPEHAGTHSQRECLAWVPRLLHHLSARGPPWFGESETVCTSRSRSSRTYVIVSKPSARQHFWCASEARNNFFWY